jgi:hypothetical protein
MAGLFALSLALSYLTWRFVEMPFRQKGSLVGRHPWASASAAGLVVLAAAAPIWLSGGWPARFTPTQNAMAAYLDYYDSQVYRRSTCFIDSHVQTESDFDHGACLALSETKPNVLILGDSHAAHLWQGMATQFPGFNVLQATASGCKPLAGGRGEAPCVNLMNRMLGDKSLLSRLDAIILSAYWQPGDLPLLQETVASLAPLMGQVHVFGPIQTYGANLPRLLALAETRGEETVMDALLPDRRETDRLLAEALSSGPARYLSIHKLLCPDGHSCLTRTPSGMPLQWDDEHLTLEGAIEVFALAGKKGLFP